VAVAFRDSTVAGQANATDWDVSLPTNAVAGDLLIAVLITDTGATMTTPAAGWTAFTGTPKDNTGTQDVRMHAYWRICPASPPATWRWTFSGNSAGGKMMLAYSGVDQTTPIHQQEHSGTAAGTSHATVAISTTVADCMLVLCAGADESATFTPYYAWPDGTWTERVDSETNNFTETGAADKLLSGTISSQSYTYTHTDSDGGVHVLAAVAPAATGTPGTMTAGTATAPAQGEAVLLGASGRLAVVEATSPADGQAVTLTAASRLVVTEAIAPAQAEAVTLDAAATLTVTAALSPAQGEAVALSGQARLVVSETLSPAQGEAVTLTGETGGVAGTMTAGTATAPAAGEAVVLSGQGLLLVAVATSPAQAENVSLTGEAILSVIAASATATAAGRFVQLVYVGADVSDGGWTGQDGGTTLSTYIDEQTADDADYIRSLTSPVSADEAKIRLAALNDPGVGTGHIVRYRYGKDQSGGDAINLTVKLYDTDGTTLIASQTHTNIADGWIDGSFTLSEAEANAITDYSGLVLGFSAVKP
jgi:hypothetical protein